MNALVCYDEPMSRLGSKQRRALARKFHALSNPHRLAVFIRLASVCGETRSKKSLAEMKRRVGELSEDLSVAPSTVSHHLKELRDAGLIHMERDGQTVGCWVDPETLRSLSAFFIQVAA